MRLYGHVIKFFFSTEIAGSEKKAEKNGKLKPMKDEVFNRCLLELFFSGEFEKNFPTLPKMTGKSVLENGK